MLHDVEIPQFHKVFLAVVDVSELVDHLFRGALQPFGIRLAFRVVIELFGHDWNTSFAVVVYPVVPAYVLSLLVQFSIVGLLKLEEIVCRATGVEYHDAGHNSTPGRAALRAEQHVVRCTTVRAVVHLVHIDVDSLNRRLVHELE